MARFNLTLLCLRDVVYGCPDAEAMAQPGYWYKRHGDQLEVGCTTGDVTWWLRCDGFNWVGSAPSRNCSIAGITHHATRQTASVQSVRTFRTKKSISLISICLTTELERQTHVRHLVETFLFACYLHTEYTEEFLVPYERTSH